MQAVSVSELSGEFLRSQFEVAITGSSALMLEAGVCYLRWELPDKVTLGDKALQPLSPCPI